MNLKCNLTGATYGVKYRAGAPTRREKEIEALQEKNFRVKAFIDPASNGALFQKNHP